MLLIGVANLFATLVFHACKQVYKSNSPCFQKKLFVIVWLDAKTNKKVVKNNLSNTY